MFTCQLKKIHSTCAANIARVIAHLKLCIRSQKPSEHTFPAFLCSVGRTVWKSTHGMLPDETTALLHRFQLVKGHLGLGCRR